MEIKQQIIELKKGLQNHQPDKLRFYMMQKYRELETKIETKIETKLNKL